MERARNLLIVDDEPNVRLMFRTTLESAGYVVAEAEDGESALLWLRGFSADLVLLDLRMPGLGGLATLEALRVEGNQVPVAMITAHGSVPDAVAAMKLGAIDFLTKPIEPHKLRNAVAEVFERHAHEPFEDSRDSTETVTVGQQFAVNLKRAKRELNRENFDQAAIFLKQAIALVPESAEAHNLMGVLHECLSENNAAYREYRAALKADKHYEPAKHNMQRYYERFTFGNSSVPIDIGGA